MEFAARLHSIGASDGRKFHMPVSQADLADAVGISPVHINRSLQSLRAEGYIRTYGRTIEIERWEEMAELAEFDLTYLHPEGPRQVP